jgi:hypothetical protein
MSIYTPYAAEIDLVPDMTNSPTYSTPDQSGYNACQSFGGAFALEGHHLRAGQPITVKRLATYRMAKEFSLSSPSSNNGASVENVASAWRAYGVPTGPGDVSPWEALPADVVSNAAQYKGVVLEPMPYINSGPAKDDTIESIFMWLDRGYFIIGTLRDTRSLHDHARGYWNWRDMDWDGRYDGEAQHVVTICGGSRQHGRFLFANHWANWGDGGFGGAPFDKFLQGPQGCFTNLQIIKNCRVQPVGVRTVPNPVPTSLSSPQLAKWEARVISALRTAKQQNDWPGALGTAHLYLKLSDKQFEMYAPALDGGPGHGLPRGTVRQYQDAGIVTMPNDFFETEA